MLERDNSIDESPELYPDWLRKIRNAHRAFDQTLSEAREEVGPAFSTKCGRIDEQAESAIRGKFHMFRVEVAESLPEAILLYKTDFEKPEDIGPIIREGAEKERDPAVRTLMTYMAGMASTRLPRSQHYLPRTNEIYDYTPFAPLMFGLVDEDRERSLDPSNPNFVGFEKARTGSWFGRFIPMGKIFGDLSFEQISIVLDKAGEIGMLAPNQQQLLEQTKARILTIRETLMIEKEAALRRHGSQLLGRALNILGAIEQYAPRGFRLRLPPVIEITQKWDAEAKKTTGEYFILLTRDKKLLLAPRARGWKRLFSHFDTDRGREAQLTGWENEQVPSLFVSKLLGIFDQDKQDIINFGHINIYRT